MYYKMDEIRNKKKDYSLSDLKLVIPSAVFNLLNQ